MNSLLFPGQGSQIVGMGTDFFKNYEQVKKIFKRADEKLDFHISKMILEGPVQELQLTKNTQPAILTVSYSIFKIIQDEFELNLDLFKSFAGHSLGEYSALVCSEALNFEDAIFLLHERGKAMQEAVPVGKGSMLAVLGADINIVKEFLINSNLNDGICEIANDNAEGQVIVSGDTETINSFQSILKKEKIKTIPLKVSAPFHCSLMKPAADKMKEKINQINFLKPQIDIISNVTTKPENDPAKIKKLLIDQIFSTVRWRESIINISKMGVDNFIEIGPGKALTGMVKRTIKNVNCFSINSIADIKILKNELKR